MFDDPKTDYHVQRHAAAAVPLPRVRLQRGTRSGGSIIQPEDNNGNLIYDTNGSPVYEIYNLAGGLCLTARNLLRGRLAR